MSNVFESPGSTIGVAIPNLHTHSCVCLGCADCFFAYDAATARNISAERFSCKREESHKRGRAVAESVTLFDWPPSGWFSFTTKIESCDSASRFQPSTFIPLGFRLLPEPKQLPLDRNTVPNWTPNRKYLAVSIDSFVLWCNLKLCISSLPIARVEDGSDQVLRFDKKRMRGREKPRKR